MGSAALAIISGFYFGVTNTTLNTTVSTNRPVYLGTCHLADNAALGLIGVTHYAVKVGDDGFWYEVAKESSTKRNTIVTTRDWDTRRKGVVVKMAGSTDKADDAIYEFTRSWVASQPIYNLFAENCQIFPWKYIVSQVNSWETGPEGHTAIGTSKESIRLQGKVTAQRVGGQFGLISGEIEGPSIGANAAYSSNNKDDNYFGWEMSMFKADARIGSACVRLQPNLSFGSGEIDGRSTHMVAGFGYSYGKGFAFHTPLGSIGFGRF